MGQTPTSRELEEAANALLTKHGNTDLARPTHLAPPTDAMAHAIRVGTATDVERWAHH